MFHFQCASSFPFLAGMFLASDQLLINVMLWFMILCQKVYLITVNLEVFERTVRLVCLSDFSMPVLSVAMPTKCLLMS